MFKTNFKALLEYDLTAKKWLAKDKDNADTKLGYAIHRMQERIDKAVKPYMDAIRKCNDDIEDYRNDHQKEENGRLVWDVVKEGGREVRERAYSRADAKALQKKIRERQEKLENELNVFLEDKEENILHIEPRYATSIPGNLSDIEKEVFSGIVIDPEMINKPVTAEAVSSNGAAVAAN